MSRTFTPWEVDNQWLIHPSVQDDVPPGDLAHFLCDLVRELADLGPIADAYADNIRYAPTYPAMMTALLFYGWSDGLFSSRRISRACTQRVDFMALTALDQLPFEDIRAFREDHADALVPLLADYLRQMQRWGIDVGLDALEDVPGAADDPFNEAAQTWLQRAEEVDASEDARFGPDARGDELPKWVPDKSKRVRKLKDARFALEEEAEDRERARRAPAVSRPDDEDEDATGFIRAIHDEDLAAMEAVPENPIARRKRERRARAKGIAPTRGRAAPEAAARSDVPPRAATVRRPSQRRPARAVESVPASPPPARRGGSRPPSRRTARPVPPEPPPVPPRAATPPSEAFMAQRPKDERLTLVKTVVATAMADGHVAGAEQRRIDKLIRILRLDTRARQEVYATLRAGVPPELPSPNELPDYEIRLHVFEQAAIMALVDGVVAPGEHQHLRQLADLLELEVHDAKGALRRANSAAGT